MHAYGFHHQDCGGYAGLACIYILFSDTAVHAFVADPDWRYQLGVWKGFGFVAFTSIALAFLLRAELAKQDALHRELEAAACLRLFRECGYALPA